jgi:hypothetical protein
MIRPKQTISILVGFVYNFYLLIRISSKYIKNYKVIIRNQHTDNEIKKERMCITNASVKYFSNNINII